MCMEASATGTPLCGTNAHCISTPGSFKCVCDTGFNGDGHTCTNAGTHVEYYRI